MATRRRERVGSGQRITSAIGQEAAARYEPNRSYPGQEATTTTMAHRVRPSLQAPMPQRCGRGGSDPAESCRAALRWQPSTARRTDPSRWRSGSARSNRSARLGHAALARKALGQPERAGHERAFGATQTVGRAVAQHQSAIVKLRRDRLRGAHHARVVVVDEADIGQQQQSGIQFGTTKAGHEDTALGIEALRLDGVADRVACPLPALERCLEAVLPAPARCRGAPPSSTSPSSARSAAARRAPPRCRDPAAATSRTAASTISARKSQSCGSGTLPRALHRPASSSSRPYMSAWNCLSAALPMRTGLEPRQPSRWPRSTSVRRRLPSTAYEHLQLLRTARRAALDEAPEAVGLGHAAQAGQRAHGEHGVADPAETVVPVALAAHVFGQRRRGRRDDGAGRRMGQRLQHDGRTGDADAGMSLRGDLRRPSAPPGERLVEVPVGLVVRRDLRWRRVQIFGRHELHREPQPMARASVRCLRAGDGLAPTGRATLPDNSKPALLPTAQYAASPSS